MLEFQQYTFINHYVMENMQASGSIQASELIQTSAYRASELIQTSAYGASELIQLLSL